MLFAGCGTEKAAKDTEAKADGTAKVILIDQDEQEFSYDIHTTGVSLTDALLAEALITEETAGALVMETIDGHTAKMEDGVLWMICDENKEQMQGMAQEITIEDGQTIYLIYTVAPTFDD